MKILILGAGKMGSFFTDVLSFEHEVAVYDVNPQRLRFMYNCYRFTKLEEIGEFKPEPGHQCCHGKIHTRCFPSGPSGIAEGLYHQRHCFRENRIKGVL